MNTETKTYSVTRNNIVAPLALTKTERVKEGQKATEYWHIDNETAFTVLKPKLDDKGKPITDNKGATLEVLDEAGTVARMLAFYGYDVLMQKFQAKCNQDFRASQLDGTKDVYTTEQKAGYLLDYINGGFGENRTVKKSPLVLKQEAWQARVKEVAALKAAGKLSEAEAAKELAAAQNEFVAWVIANPPTA